LVAAGFSCKAVLDNPSAWPTPGNRKGCWLHRLGEGTPPSGTCSLTKIHGKGGHGPREHAAGCPPAADLDHVLRKEGGRVNELWGKLLRRAPCAVLFAPLWCGANVAFNLSLALAPGPLRSVHPHRNQMPHINHHTNPRIRGAVSTSGEWPSLPDPSNRLHPHTPHRISYPHTPPPPPMGGV